MGNVTAVDGLLRRTKVALCGGLAECRHHHPIEPGDGIDQLHTNDTFGTNHALARQIADAAKLQNLADGRADREVASAIGCRALRGALHHDRNTGQWDAILARDIASDGLLLRDALRSKETCREQQREGSSDCHSLSGERCGAHHGDGHRLVTGTRRALQALVLCQERALAQTTVRA